MKLKLLILAAAALIATASAVQSCRDMPQAEPVMPTAETVAYRENQRNCDTDVYYTAVTVTREESIPPDPICGMNRLVYAEDAHGQEWAWYDDAEWCAGETAVLKMWHWNDNLADHEIVAVERID